MTLNHVIQVRALVPQPLKTSLYKSSNNKE